MLIGLFRGIFLRGAKQISDDEIFSSYATILEQASFGAGGSANISTLPASKEEIKRVLVDFATKNKLSGEALGFVKVGFLELSAFQEGGGTAGVASL